MSTPHTTREGSSTHPSDVTSAERRTPTSVPTPAESAADATEADSISLPPLSSVIDSEMSDEPVEAGSTERTRLEESEQPSADRRGETASDERTIYTRWYQCERMRNERTDP